MTNTGDVMRDIYVQLLNKNPLNDVKIGLLCRGGEGMLFKQKPLDYSFRLSRKVYACGLRVLHA